MVNRADIEASQSRSGARRRIIDIYINRGIDPPHNIEAQVDRVVGSDGAAYLDTIRGHADRDASAGLRRQRETGEANTGTRRPATSPDPGPSGPDRDWRAEARGLFPWLTPALLDQFADAWAETGSPDAALGRVRQTSEWEATFPGLRRDDGSLRMSEGQYFAERAGMREALAEFGYDPEAYEDRFADLFEQEVGARELFQVASEAFDRFVEPGRGHTPLTDMFLNRFFESGSRQRALEAVRDSSEYDDVFAGNRRDDGSLRMDEPDYFAYKRGWQRALAGFGLDPREFEARGRLEQSVEGELSVQEVNQRLQTVQDGILENLEETERFYADNYGLELTDEAILAGAIDPDVERDLLEQRVTAAQIGGEASLAGFVRDVDRAEELARAGLAQGDARQLYSQAARRLPGISAAARRANMGGIGLTQFEEAVGLSDAEESERIERALRREQSGFSSRRGMVRADPEGALTGLRQR